MKWVVFILYIILSSFSGERAEIVGADAPDNRQGTVSEQATAESPSGFTPERDICLMAAQGYTFSGNENTGSISFRVVKSGRRTAPQVRSTFRILKGEKVIDNNHLHPFLAQSVLHQEGTYIPERYLFSICRLRL